MPRLLASSLVWLACITPALAQDTQHPAAAPAPHDQTAVAPNPDQRAKDAETTQFVTEGLRTRLARAGFTNIEMLPTSFLVRAKDADGHAVLLQVSPDAVMEWQQTGPQQHEDGGDETGQPTDQEKF